MATISEIESYLQNLLSPQTISDYCPNGLQIAGRSTIKKLITGVTACQALIDQAAAENADAILVHHGFFWKNENPCITGIKYNRIKKLLENGINLLAYHLPLDVHPEYGNNMQLAKLLNLEVDCKVKVNNLDLLWVGQLKNPISNTEFANILNDKLQRQPFFIAPSEKPIKTIAWCTGAAQDFIEHAVAEKVDAYLTGEVSEQTVHIARETGIHFFAAGHNATERYGVSALGKHLAEQFNIEHKFIDIPNPI